MVRTVIHYCTKVVSSERDEEGGGQERERLGWPVTSVI